MTLAKLADPRRRPTELFRQIRAEDLELQPEQLRLDQRKFLENVRSAKRGSDTVQAPSEYLILMRGMSGRSHRLCSRPCGTVLRRDSLLRPPSLSAQTPY